MHERTDEILVELEQMVRKGGSDDEIRAIELRLSLHFEELSEFMRDELASILAGLGRALWRMSQT